MFIYQETERCGYECAEGTDHGISEGNEATSMTVQREPEGNERKYLHKFADFAASRKRVLEIGCGEGRLTWKYARETRSTIAIDLDADGLRVATLDRPSDLEGKVHFSLARSEQLPFSNQTFDMGVLAWSF